jgi:hypothetical protein
MLLNKFYTSISIRKNITSISRSEKITHLPMARCQFEVSQCGCLRHETHSAPWITRKKLAVVEYMKATSLASQNTKQSKSMNMHSISLAIVTYVTCNLKKPWAR